MATKNKKDTVTDLLTNITTNTSRDNTALRVKVPFNDTFNSVSFNITVAQLQAEDDSAEHSLANILDVGKQGVFAYDSLDTTAADDGGGGCIVTSTNKRYKRRVEKAINAIWYGQANPYFNQVSDATTAVKSFTRFVGLEIIILLNGTPTTYWFRDGILDAHLVVKVSETHSIDFAIGDGGALTPADAATDYIDPSLTADKIILGFWITGKKTRLTIKPTVLAITDTYAQFDPANTKISLINGTYNQDNDYSIMYK